MSVLVASIAALLAVAYLVLAGIGSWELTTDRSDSVPPRFGLVVVLLASDTGLHHLLHAVRAASGDDVSVAIAATGALALVPTLTFVGLRIEILSGRRGDRFVSGTPNWLIATPLMTLVAAGGLFVWSATSGSAMGTWSRWSDLTRLVVITNVALGTCFLLVGWPLMRTQIRRRSERGGWSVSGLSLSTMFMTCGLSYLVHAFEAQGSRTTEIVDALSVPTALWLLLAGRSLYGSGIVAWNARPAVGNRRAAPRAAPWETPVRQRPRLRFDDRTRTGRTASTATGT